MVLGTDFKAAGPATWRTKSQRLSINGGKMING
jgi:hypothetical protein